MRILGIDLGTSSLGWAIMEWDTPDTSALPARIVDSGVRIFPEGVNKNSSGTEISLGAHRRLKRSQRKQLDRKARRKRKLFNALSFYSLLPRSSELTDFDATLLPQRVNQRPHFFAAFDKALAHQWREKCALDASLWKYLNLELTPTLDPKVQTEQLHRLALRLPYLLRALSAERFVEPYELGRALAHLGQRRGYQSNRKMDAGANTADKEVSEYLEKKEILATTLSQTKQTLGQYLACQPPVEKRLRNQPTNRAMYKTEFNAIRQAQKSNPQLKLTDADWKKIEKIIFDQRPLKSQKHLKNHCPLEPLKQGCPKARLIAQEFKIRFALLNTCYRLPADGIKINLNTEQFEKCFQFIWQGNKFSEAQFIKLLQLDKKTRWNLSDDDKQDLKSLQSPTVNKILEALNVDDNAGLKFWNELEPKQADFVDELLSFEKIEPLEKYLKKNYGVESKTNSLTPNQIKKLANIVFEPDCTIYSAKAITKLLPYLRKNLRIDKQIEGHPISVKETLYPTKPTATCKLLPPLTDVVGEIRNPVVKRALGQIREVVNAIILRHGLPNTIRIELAREVKKSAKERDQIKKQNFQREKIRDQVRKELKADFSEFVASMPKRSDVDKYLLWRECGKVCPYTGKTISANQLFNGTVDVEHITPYSRCLDDSYANKTLCFSGENKIKGNRTPWEAYHSDATKWNAILDRIKAWPEAKSDPLLKGHSWAKAEKLRRVRDVQTPEVDSFIARQLVDTQYSSKLARLYLQCLYDNAAKVQTSTGALTATMRQTTGIEGYLGQKEDGKKSRDDHRHHVVDALMITLATPSRIKAMADAVTQSELKGERHWKALHNLFEPFLKNLTDAVSLARISFYRKNRVRGSMHKETQYGIRNSFDIKGKPTKIVVGTHKITADDLLNQESRLKLAAKILDENLQNFVGNAIPANISEIDGAKTLIGPNSKPIQKIRTEKGKFDSLIAVGPTETPRYFGNDENHHIEIWADAKGNWHGKVMNLYEAHQLKREGKKVSQAMGAPGETFVMQLFKQDVLYCESVDEKRPAQYWIVEAIGSNGQLAFVPLFDSRALS